MLEEKNLIRSTYDTQSFSNDRSVSKNENFGLTVILSCTPGAGYISVVPCDGSTWMMKDWSARMFGGWELSATEKSKWSDVKPPPPCSPEWTYHTRPSFTSRWVKLWSDAFFYYANGMKLIFQVIYAYTSVCHFFSYVYNEMCIWILIFMTDKILSINTDNCICTYKDIKLSRYRMLKSLHMILITM